MSQRTYKALTIIALLVLYAVIGIELAWRA